MIVRLLNGCVIVATFHIRTMNGVRGNVCTIRGFLVCALWVSRAGVIGNLFTFKDGRALFIRSTFSFNLSISLLWLLLVRPHLFMSRIFFVSLTRSSR